MNRPENRHRKLLPALQVHGARRQGLGVPCWPPTVERRRPEPVLELDTELVDRTLRVAMDRFPYTSQAWAHRQEFYAELAGRPS